jgi:hypothetical protein
VAQCALACYAQERPQRAWPLFRRGGPKIRRSTDPGGGLSRGAWPTPPPRLLVSLVTAPPALADQVELLPRHAASGPLPGLPSAVCLRDLAAAEGRLTHFLLGHPGEAPEPGHVAAFLFCLAVVDGARAVGFDVGPEERRLERLLNELEARRRG